MSVNRLVESLGELDSQRSRVVRMANRLKRKTVEFSRLVRNGCEINAPEELDELCRDVDELRYESIVLSVLEGRVRVLEKEIV